MKKNILIILFVAMLTSCVSPKSRFPEMDAGEIAIETKRQQDFVNSERKKILLQSREHEIKFKKRIADTSVKIIKGGMELCKKLGKEKEGCVYSFEYSPDRVVNAYADGKKIVITKGMLRFAKTENELALVMGHEYAHNLMGHIKAAENNMAIGRFLGVLADTLAASQGMRTGSTFGNIGAKAGKRSYSREFEKEADYIGLYITAFAGFDIKDAPQFWRRMSLIDDKAIYSATTHPSNPARSIGLQKTVDEIQRKKENGARILPEFKDEM